MTAEGEAAPRAPGGGTCHPPAPPQVATGHTLGGPPCPRLAHALAASRSRQHPAPARMSHQPPALRWARSGRSARPPGPSRPSPARSPPRPPAWAWARTPAPGASGARALGATTAMRAGASRRRCFPPRPGPGCTPPAGGVQGLSPPSRGPRSPLKPCAHAAAPVQSRGGLARPRGARPTSGGLRRASGPPPRSPRSGKRRAVRSPHRRNGAGGWNKPSTARPKPGGALLVSQHGRPCVASTSRGPYPPELSAATSRALRTPAR
jgi:hypothetical protein